MDRLVGGIGTLRDKKPEKTVGSFWPYPMTLFDFVRRAMPLNAPHSLTPDEVYAVSAYGLFLNGSSHKTSYSMRAIPRRSRCPTATASSALIRRSVRAGDLKRCRSRRVPDLWRAMSELEALCN
jgi:hypothetical protein